ncbi:hypothetical protein M426DRAFT_27948 [Hypoxylon sp. CI-4A]|nr:hypothetical protein M426DRAFT_27948 [Hypoxylon sp. CI-4A]
MAILTQLVAKTNQLLLRASTIPAACYNSCNNVYSEAQRIGKSDRLCKDSLFVAYLQNCRDCVKNETGSDDLSSTNLAPFIDYCASVSTSLPSPVVTVSNLGMPNYSTSRRSALWFSHTNGVLNPLAVTTFLGGVETTLAFSTVVTLYSLLPSTGVILTTQTLDGKATIFNYTTTYVQLPSSGNNSTLIPHGTSTLAQPTPSLEQTGPSEPSSQAWIAGPVVGSVAGVAMVALGGFLLWRRRRFTRKGRQKHELHGNTAIKSELDPTTRPQELSADNSRLAGPHELVGDVPYQPVKAATHPSEVNKPESDEK